MNFSLVLLLILGIGCGKKVWPEPDAEEEKFSLHIEEVVLEDKCLYLTAEIRGNQRNLAGLVLELEKSEIPCPGCPFLVSESFAPALDSPEVHLQDCRIKIVYCFIDSRKYYRIRLTGRNVFPEIQDVRSNVIDVF